MKNEDQCKTSEENSTVSWSRSSNSAGRSSRIFVIPSPQLSICILSAELGSCMYWSQFFSYLCAGGKCRSSGWCQVPVLVEDGSTVKCSRNFSLSFPKLCLNPWSRYLGDLILNISSLQIQVHNTAQIVLETREI